MQEQYYQHILSNGIRLLYVPSQIPITYCGFAINAGTRDELDNEQGIAHFVEHMLFKGTTHRRAFHIINRLESVGGQLDAYTTKEETFIYAAVPQKYTSRAMELLNDLVFNSTFPQHELEKERDVILDEIQSYNDSPSELIYDDFEELLYPHDALGRNILGTVDTLEKFNSQDLKNYTNRCHTTDEMVFFITGDLPFNKIIKLAERYFTHPATTRNFKRNLPIIGSSKIVKKPKDTWQTHCLMGTEAFALNDTNRLPFVVLNNILGGPMMSSKLNLSIREHNGLAYNIESGISTYSDTGVFNIYFACDPKFYSKCHRLVCEELKKLCDKGLSDRQIKLAQRQIEGQMLISSQNHENRILGMAKAFLHTNQCKADAYILEKVRAITASQLQEIAQKIFNVDQFIQLIYTASEK